jgi:hypothetical protein
MIDHHGLLSTDGITGVTWKPLMLRDMKLRMAMMWMLMLRKKHRKPMMY